MTDMNIKRINPDSILVKIEKKKAIERKQKIGSILIPPQFTFMLYNLQCGEIITIGTRAQEAFKAMQLGDSALFHHAIESNANRLLYTDEEGNEYRQIVNIIPESSVAHNNNQIYGIIKKDGTLIPFDTYLFLDNNLEIIEEELKSSFLDLNPAKSVDNEALVARKQEELSEWRKSLESTASKAKTQEKLTESINIIKDIVAQQESLAQFNNKPKIAKSRIAHINNDNGHLHALSAGMHVVVDPTLLYPLNIADKSFLLIKSSYLLGHYNVVS